jgi:hypothetical protein
LLHPPLLRWLDIGVQLSFFVTLWVLGEFQLATMQALTFTCRERMIIRCAVALGGICFYPLVYSTSIGQIQTLLTLAFVLAAWLWLRGDKVLAGLCIGFICVFRPTMIFFAAWAIFRRQWRFLISFAGLAAGVQALAMACFGWRMTLKVFAAISFFGPNDANFTPLQSIKILFERLYWGSALHPPFNRVVYACTTLTTLLIVVVALLLPDRQRWRNSTTDFVFFGLCVTLASSLMWPYHYSIFLAGTILLLSRFLVRAQRLPLPFLAAYAVLANAWPMLTSLFTARWSWLLSYDLFAAVAILALLARSSPEQTPVVAPSP